MSSITGVAQRISSSFKGCMIEDTWYNSKYPVFEGIRKGDIVSFDVEAGKDGSSMFVKRGSKITVEGATSVPTKEGKPASGKPNAYEVGAAVGMAVNNAVQLCIAERGAFDEDYIKDIAGSIYSLAEGLKAKAVEGTLGKSKAPVSAVVDMPEGDDPF